MAHTLCRGVGVRRWFTHPRLRISAGVIVKGVVLGGERARGHRRPVIEPTPYSLGRPAPNHPFPASTGRAGITEPAAPRTRHARSQVRARRERHTPRQARAFVPAAMLSPARLAVF